MSPLVLHDPKPRGTTDELVATHAGGPGLDGRPAPSNGRRRRSSGDSGFRPIRSLEVDLEAGLCSLLDVVDPGGDGSQPALVLVRLHSHPLGFISIDLSDDLPDEAWVRDLEVLGDAITEHLDRDGMSRGVRDVWAGVARPDTRRLPCLEDRRMAKARAVFTTVVVATRERPSSLERCIDSLLRLEYASFEVVIVDNAPETDDTAAVVRSRYGEDARVRYVVEPARGLAAAHNCGISAARGKIVAFTDDDVIVDRYWLSELVAPMLADERVAASTGLIAPAELETPSQVLLELGGNFSKGFAPRRFDLGENRPADPLFPFTAGRLGSGANMAFSHAVLNTLGGFDPCLGTGTPARGGDDLAGLYSVVAAGNSLCYQPGAIVWHHHHRDEAALSRQAYGYGIGLGAYLTSVTLRHPRLAFGLLFHPVAIVRHLAGRTRARTNALADLLDEIGCGLALPASLERTRRKGVVLGPAAYLRSRREHRRHLEAAS